MTTTIRSEAEKILTIAGIGVEAPVLSCEGESTESAGDDVCKIDFLDWDKYMEGKPEAHRPADVRFDDLFSRANALNLARHAPREMDTHNYFFRLDPNAVFYRRENVARSNLGEGGFLFRVPGGREWRELTLQQIQQSPELRAAIVPILLSAVGSREGYDRLNGQPHHGDDYGYVQAKAIDWLNELIPEGDADYRAALVRAFPSMNEDGMFYAGLRLRSEGHGEDVERALVALMDDPVRGRTARTLLSDISSVGSQYWSLKKTFVPQFTAESFGAVFVPLQLEVAPARVSWRGEKEPVGSYTVAGAGIQFCYDSAIDCAERRGFRFGAMLEASMMLNGFGYYAGSLKLFAGNEYVTGFAEGGVNIFPTGGFQGEGYYGDIITHGALGAGVRVNPYPRLPFMIPVGFRLNPEEPKGAAIYAGVGGVY